MRWKNINYSKKGGINGGISSSPTFFEWKNIILKTFILLVNLLTIILIPKKR